MSDVLYLKVDDKIVAHNANGWPFPEAKDYEKSIAKFLNPTWKSWSIIRVYKTSAGKKIESICGKFR